MAGVTDDQLLRLRLKYQTAYTAHRSCMKAIERAGSRPPQRLLDEERRALDELAEARRAFAFALLTTFTPDDPRLQ